MKCQLRTNAARSSGLSSFKWRNATRGWETRPSRGGGAGGRAPGSWRAAWTQRPVAAPVRGPRGSVLTARLALQARRPSCPPDGGMGAPGGQCRAWPVHTLSTACWMLPPSQTGGLGGVRGSGLSRTGSKSRVCRPRLDSLRRATGPLCLGSRTCGRWMVSGPLRGRRGGSVRASWTGARSAPWSRPPPRSPWQLCRELGSGSAWGQRTVRRCPGCDSDRQRRLGGCDAIWWQGTRLLGTWPRVRMAPCGRAHSPSLRRDGLFISGLVLSLQRAVQQVQRPRPPHPSSVTRGMPSTPYCGRRPLASRHTLPPGCPTARPMDVLPGAAPRTKAQQAELGCGIGTRCFPGNR